MKKKLEKAKEITPADIRRVVKQGLESNYMNASQFYKKMATKLGITVKQRTFEMFVSSDKMRGAGCLIPAYQYFTGNKIIRTGSPTKGVKFYVLKKKRRNGHKEALPL